MRKLVLTLMASAAGVMAFSAAQAADAVDQVPEAPVAETFAAPPQGWTGAYIGGGVTYDWGRMGGGDRDIDGVGGTIYGGYNWQSGQIVYGGEADISYNGADGDAGGPGLTGESGVNGSIRGRVGYDMNPFLIYGTAGLAVGNHELSDGADSDSKTAFGYTVGAGVEALVTDNITARVEYRYTDYQSKDFDLSGTTYSRGFDDHSVKVGIGVKF